MPYRTHHSRSAPFVATCPDCEIERSSDSATELVAFYRRHHRHTGHDIVVTRADLEFSAAVTAALDASDDVAAVVDGLDARYGVDKHDSIESGTDGVPIGIVVAAMSERGFTVGETLEAIAGVRMTGALYEPRDDHLAAF
ncbi:hypothetical protein [Natrialba asiatica]|uniref:Uncharacterized protein n=1 Tax=Natrialba asiatica (strain ATCC 700177 / DSM 12278 / JCM 9576 / FERM P-10747 / NBRC 102637 / 172P1) TaxID=29540 RepID=M0AJA7_NATA1|nr:hypothetical protein [Natrialba asiatica]ELY97962.1 hypothetical protein C481_18540 [Natrialba asiatica DSM 12278]